MRVMHVINSLDYGGAERMLVSLVKAILGECNQQYIVLLKNEEKYSSFTIDESIATVKRFDINKKTRFIGTLVGIVNVIKEFKPDVIQSWMYHSDLITTIALILSGRRRQTKFFWGVRCSNLHTQYYSLQIRLVMRACIWLSQIPDAIIINSIRGKEHHMKIGYKAKDMVLINNGVDTNLFRPDMDAYQKIRGELGIPEDRIVLAHVARVDPMKDHDTFLKAMAKVTDVTALLIGRGTESLPLQEGVYGLGERQDVHRLLAASNIIVSSSAFGEGFSNALAEGMACGLPAIATDVGDALRIIGDCGIIVAPRDSDAMAAAICECASKDREELIKLGAKARERVRMQFSIEHSAAAFSRFYLQMISEKQVH